MAGKGMPPGSRQGITAAGGILQGHRKAGVGTSAPGTSLAGHTAVDIGSVAPCDENAAPQRAGKQLFGHFSD